MDYRILPGTTSRGISASYIVWDSTPVTMTADEVIRASSSATARDGELQEAEEFLRELLANGAVTSQEGLAAALAQGISKKTLERARKRLGVTPFKEGFQGAWSWKLP